MSPNPFPGRVVLAHPFPPAAADALSTLSREKRVRVVADIRNGDPRLADRYADVWEAVRRPSGIGAAESRRELEDPLRLAAAMVLAGQADAVVTGPGPHPAVLRRRGSTLSSLCSFRRDRDSGVAVELCPGQEITPQHLAEAALGGLKIARHLCRETPSVEFVLGTVTAALGTRRRYESEETAARSRVEEAVRTLLARDGSASVSASPVSGLSAGTAHVLVLATGTGEDLRYRLEREFPGGEIVGPLIQGALVPLHRVSGEASAERIVDEVRLMMLATTGG